MERNPYKQVRVWSKSRAGSFVLLAFSAVILLYVIKVSFDFITLQSEKQRLNVIKQQIIDDNIELTIDNPTLNDPNYFTVYVRDNYIYDGSKFKKIGD